jgi:nickel/cobalt exporter
VGLAITLVASGALAALSLRQASRRWSGFGDLAAKAPYASSILIMAVGLWVGWQGWRALA